MNKAVLDAAVTRRLASLSEAGLVNAGNRLEMHAALTEQVAAEHAEMQTASALAEEARTERARIAAVVQAGKDRDRPRQALRLALAGPVSVAQAAAILATLPRDADAPQAALALPGLIAFGSAAAQEERARIASILGHPEAQGRFRSACAVALEGDEAIPAAAALALLAGLPLEATGPRISPIAARAEGLAEFGGDSSSLETKAERIAAGWTKAAAEANRSIGVPGAGAERPAEQPRSISELDQHLGLTATARTVAEQSK